MGILHVVMGSWQRGNGVLAKKKKTFTPVHRTLIPVYRTELIDLTSHCFLPLPYILFLALFCVFVSDLSRIRSTISIFLSHPVHSNL